MHFIKKYGVILIPLIIGGLSAFFVDTDFYRTIEKPFLAPPPWLFPVVWTILYLLLGISLYFIYKDGNTKFNKYLFYLQLVLNFVWVFVFFKLHSLLLSFVLIISLAMLSFFSILQYKNYNKISGYLFIPYLLWVCFASYLTWSIYLLN